MITFYNHSHTLHQGKMEMFRGQMVPCFEVAARVDHVLSELVGRKLGSIQAPESVDPAVLTRIHDPAYLHFLEHAWDDWVAMDPANKDRDALPSVWPNHGLRNDVLPENFAARMGRYAFDTGSPLTSGTWAAAVEGAHCAISAAHAVVDGARSAFALSRPPGHHAGTDFFGGYCFLNNAALAAQACATAGWSVWRFWTWTTTMATARSRFSMNGRTYFLPAFTVIRAPSTRSSWGMRTKPARRRRGVQPQPAIAAGYRVQCLAGCAQACVAPGVGIPSASAGSLARAGYFRRRSDIGIQATKRRLFCGWRGSGSGWAADGFCLRGWLCRGATRRERGQCA